jgi:3-deoxy-manno-octulosonate cytidylyltransferase (CMP-KDO synthetase)
MIIIPARLKSTRLPNKVLAKIGDTPMVIKTALRVKELDSVVIATDSNEVIEVAKEYGIEAVLTSNEHKSGTDRVYEAAKKLNLAPKEPIINVQADEPFIEQEVVSKLIELTKKCANNPKIIATTCYKLINKERAKDPNIVKVVTNLNNLALYFSRSLIPYAREDNLNSYKAHLGLYGFTMQKLEIFCTMKSGILEDIEKLEQLRILDNGYKIALVEVESKSFGIDTQADLDRANKLHTL